jgi:hypothetical protein
VEISRAAEIIRAAEITRVGVVKVFVFIAI